jgi:hypothetical protein
MTQLYQVQIPFGWKRIKFSRIGAGFFLCASFLFSAGLFAQPTISSLSPASGPRGTTVTITGTHFSTTPSSNIVFFGAVQAPVTAATSTTLTVTVPDGASYQPVSVTTGGFTGYSSLPFITTFSDLGQFKATAFSDRTDLRTGNGPQSILTADLDGDGKPDLAVADADSNIISVYKNTSTPSAVSYIFQGSYALNANDYPTGITAGDIDGDGKPDLVVSNFFSGTVAVFRNVSSAGNISLASFLTYTTGSYPSQAAIADLDGDGRPEIITASQGDNTVSYIPNTSTPGTISFGANTPLPAPPGAIPAAVIAVDLDGDGKPDLATANTNTNTVSIFRNTSTSAGVFSFAASIDFNAGNLPINLAAGDLDGDGKPDIAVANDADNTVSVLRNTSTTGSPNFDNHLDYVTGSGAYGLTISDMDGDGKPDLAVTNTNDNTVSALRNTSAIGNISFAGHVDYPTGFFPMSVAITDLDGDGKPDMAVADNTEYLISILREQRSTNPLITGFSPQTGVTGTVVTITGANFTIATAVSFGDTAAASFTIVSDSIITATVGNGASGNVSVTAPAGGDSAAFFTFNPPPPPPPLHLTGFTPDSAMTGVTVTITGISLTGTNSVTFGSVPATSFTVTSDSTLTAVVGAGASGEIIVSGFNGIDSIAGFVYVSATPPPPPPPAIVSFFPSTAPQGGTVTIVGSGFTGITGVSFGGSPAASFVVLSDSTISAVVGTGASGIVFITGPNGTSSLAGFIFKVITPPPPPPPPFLLQQFSGTVFNNKPFLQWTCVNEASISSYTVQESSDSVRFSTIGIVPVSTRPASSHTYTFTDKTPRFGINYYRLQINDTAGHATFSDVIGVELATESFSKMSVFPNPVKYGIITIDLPTSTHTSTLQLTDLVGRVLTTMQLSPGTPRTYLNLSSLPPGTYELSWTDGFQKAVCSVMRLYP